MSSRSGPDSRRNLYARGDCAGMLKGGMNLPPFQPLVGRGETEIVVPGSDAMPPMSPEERAAYQAARKRGRQAIADGRVADGNKVLAWLDDLAAGRNVTAPQVEPAVPPRV